MNDSWDLQDAMRTELDDKSVLQLALQGASEYLDEVFDRHVKPTEQAVTDLIHFEESLPPEAGNALEIIEDLIRYGGPATMPILGGRYFGFVCGSSVPAGLAAKQLASAWDQNSAMEVMSPLCSKLETVVEEWIKEILGLPASTVAGFVSGTSMANVCGLAAARYRILERAGWDVNKQGLNGAPAIRIVAGAHAHSSVLKAVNLLGLGSGNIEYVEVDGQGRIIPDALPELDSQTLLILQAGNVNSGSLDPFHAICHRARQKGAWIHIDGAFGLWAGAHPGFNHLTAGMADADSWAVDAHKTLNAPYDSGIVLCRDPQALSSALHMSAGYLIEGKSRDGMFYTPEMSRRGRIIELWATMRYLGRQGIEEMVWAFHERAVQFANELREVEGFSIMNDVVFNQVIVQCASDDITESVTHQIQELRTCWVGGSTWFGKKVIRVSICSWATTEEDISKSVRSFARALDVVSSPSQTG